MTLDWCNNLWLLIEIFRKNEGVSEFFNGAAFSFMLLVGVTFNVLFVELRVSELPDYLFLIYCFLILV